MSLVEPLRPACAICIPILAWEYLCTKSVTRFHAATCSGLYMPAQPGVMRAARLTSVISVMTRPAPPTARLPRCTRCQSLIVPSSAEYMHIGEQTIRFSSSMPRSLKGVNIGGGAGSVLVAPVVEANHSFTERM